MKSEKAFWSLKAFIVVGSMLIDVLKYLRTYPETAILDQD